MQLNALDPRSTRDLTPDLIDDEGQLGIPPAAYYRGTTQDERSLFCLRHGLYLLPTEELVELLRLATGGRRAIEIGSGNGVLGKALGITCTDSFMQEEPHVVAIYKKLGQPTVRYGKHVLKFDALEAVRRFEPEVVVGAWITHKYRPEEPWRGGNEYGVELEKVADLVDTLFLLGNENVHDKSPIWDRATHVKIHLPELIFSRAFNGSPDFLSEWTK